MTTATKAALYSTEILSLATELANYPLRADCDHFGEARSRTCGSSLKLGFSLDPSGHVSGLGISAASCAIGQASAAIMARHAKDKTLADFTQILEQIEAWLGGNGIDPPLPDWPELAKLSAVIDHKARHGAFLLPWKAACEALCNSGSTG
ncbi:MAG: iron-sulfur cluster assembly scaffold protein [Sphingomonadales bacterium]|nr:MAG: iron-sulfur cluster assembly scaffold protein [Sphingomonadales bacterium]